MHTWAHVHARDYMFSRAGNNQVISLEYIETEEPSY